MHWMEKGWRIPTPLPLSYLFSHLARYKYPFCKVDKREETWTVKSYIERRRVDTRTIIYSWQKYISLESFCVVYKIFLIFYNETASKWVRGRSNQEVLRRACDEISRKEYLIFVASANFSVRPYFSCEIRSRNIFKLGGCPVLPSSLVNRKSNWRSYEGKPHGKRRKNSKKILGEILLVLFGSELR